MSVRKVNWKWFSRRKVVEEADDAHMVPVVINCDGNDPELFAGVAVAARSHTYVPTKSVIKQMFECINHIPPSNLAECAGNENRVHDSCSTYN